jgi:hypothetical protein
MNGFSKAQFGGLLEEMNWMTMKLMSEKVHAGVMEIE